MNDDDLKLVLLYSAKSEPDLMLKMSILDSAEVIYMVKNYATQDLFGAGKLGSGYNLLIGNPEIWISEHDYEYANELLLPYEENDGENETIETSDEKIPEEITNFSGKFLIFIVISICVFLGILFLNYLRVKYKIVFPK